MEELILELLNRENKALSIDEIKDSLNIDSIEGLKDLIRVLNKLEEDFKICYTKKISI